MSRYIPFNGNVAFWQSLGLWLNSGFFFKHRYFLSRKHIIQQINTPESRERKLDFEVLTYVSSSICWITTAGLISIRFTGIDLLHILYTSTKIYASWIRASSWFCDWNTAITCASIDLPIGVHDGDTFPQWFCNSEANRHEICTWLKQRVKINVLRISLECVKFQSMKLAMMFKLNLKKIRSSPLDLAA